MVEPSQDPAFLAQSAHAFTGREAAQQLDGGLLLEMAIAAFGKEHGAHPSRPQLAHKAPGTEMDGIRGIDAGDAIHDDCMDGITLATVGGEQLHQHHTIRLGQPKRIDLALLVLLGQLAEPLKVSCNGIERGHAYRSSTLRNHALARRRSRSTVPSETSSEAATSRRSRPPK